MNVVLHIPDDLAERLGADGDVERQALEAFAADAYRTGRLTKPDLRRLLGFEVLNEIDGFMRAHHLFEPFSVEDVEREVSDLQRLGF